MAGIYSFSTEARIHDFHFIPLGYMGEYMWAPEKVFLVLFIFFLFLIQLNWEAERLSLAVALVNQSYLKNILLP